MPRELVNNRRSSITTTTSTSPDVEATAAYGDSAMMTEGYQAMAT
jgi:hypothetical protein